MVGDLPADHGDPGGEVVVVGDAGDVAVAEVEEGTDAEVVGLALGGGEGAVGFEVGAADEEFGGGAGVVTGGHDDEVFDGFAVVFVHAEEEGAEGVLAGFGGALVGVVDDVVGEEGEHGLGLADVEGVVVGADGFDGGHVGENLRGGREGGGGCRVGTRGGGGLVI